MPFVYILRVEDLDRCGHVKKNILYTGYTRKPIERRIKEHIDKRGSRFMRIYHPNSRKILVHVERVARKPPNYKYHPREYEIKKMSRSKKLELIVSDRNVLEDYRCRFGHIGIRLWGDSLVRVA